MKPVEIKFAVFSSSNKNLSLIYWSTKENVPLSLQKFPTNKSLSQTGI